MTTCKECASEISETEAFCPYCGIKIETAPELIPVPEVVAAVDPEFESTIVITPGEAAAMKEEMAASAASAEPTPIVETAPPPSPFDPPTPASHRTAPTLEDIPTPSILSAGFARPTDPDISIASESTPTKESPVFDEQVVSEPQAEVEADHAIPVFEPAAEAELQTAEPEPSQEMVVEETPVAEEPPPAPVFEPEEEKTPTFDLAPPPAETSEPVEETPPAIPVFEPSPVSEFSQPSGDISVTEEPAAAPEPVSTFEPAEEPLSISKPLDNLEEPVVEPSVFDSVRIMEGQPAPDYVDTVIPGQGFQIPPVAPVSSAAAETPAPAERSGDISKSTGLGDTDSRRASKLKPLPEGTILNSRYEVVRKIGGGGMGAVYLASDNNLGGVLRAVKEMVQAHIEEDQQEKAINDFKRESMILSTLDHPSIPTIYDYFYDAEESRFYLVMKYISGGDLASKLRSSADGKIEELIVTEWAIQLTDVLNYLHNQPSTIVYRDLKPSNIMLDGNSSRVMLIDFGIARNISQKEEKGVTAVGTMGYAPPELFSGNVEPRSDIYSLGSTMFHLLTGADPQSNPLLIFDFQKNPRPRQINSRLSDQMERILMRTVEYNAESRFSSAAELKAVLEDHLVNLRSGNLTFGVTEAPVSVSLANQSVFCGFCGQRIVATDLFCAFCGAKQPLAQQGVHSEIYHKGAATARLVIEGTSELSAPIYALQKDDNLIGRRDPMSNIFPEVDLSKYDPQTKISRRHAKIWRDGTSFMLEDLGSSNGTIIEGGSANVFKLPAHQPYKLSSGDRIKIGDTRLHFVVG